MLGPRSAITLELTVDDAIDRRTGFDTTHVVVATSLDEAVLVSGASKEVLSQLGWESDSAQVLTVLASTGNTIVIAVPDVYDALDVLSIGADLWKVARHHQRISVDPAYLNVVIRALAHGSYSYRDRTNAPGDDQLPTSLSIALQSTDDALRARMILNVEHHVAEVRDLCNHPASHCTPHFFVNHFAHDSGVDHKSSDRGAIRHSVVRRDSFVSSGLHGLAAVSRASLNEPAFMELNYSCGASGAPRVVLVGKGVTFDTGGTNLKTGESINGLHMDMAGAAVVCATIRAAAELHLAVDITAMVSLTDNCIGPAAMMPGDVITYANGTTVEVRDTDAEGRLLLADLVLRACHSQPDLIISVSTLTQSVIDGLGDQVACFTTTSNDAAALLERAAVSSNEAFCRFPLYRPYRRSLDSRIADLANISSSKYGDAIMAGLFLEAFRSGPPLLHLDIAGKETEPETPFGGATGFGVWTLVEALTELANNQPAPSSESPSNRERHP